MKLSYIINIETPSTHQVKVVIIGERLENQKKISFFLPRWSPGSYLIREYSRHLSKLKAVGEKGEVLYFSQVDISTFELDFLHPTFQSASKKFEISYEVYCHELTVRTSHVDHSHAFLHLPCLLMGVLGEEMLAPELTLKFPSTWSKVSTGLKDISKDRNTFHYISKNYDELIDSPIEIGCHETDGFNLFGVDHELAFYGNQLVHNCNLKEDMKTIVNTIGNFFGGVPYERYSFITHFVPGIYGGLEHLNSTALHFCPTGLNQRKNYINFLCLVSHEYFHLWNVKRIRPIELGPFDYLKEAMTKMLWLAEGLTSLMDELFVLRSGLINLEEYLDLQKDNLNRYLSVPGKKFHSLDDSSFNAWIKLYRPDENSNNSSISYYLKGGIVFWTFHLMASQKSLSIDQLVLKLWNEYLKNPNNGITEEQFYSFVEEIYGYELREKLEQMIKTTNEIDFETYLNAVGISVNWEKSESTYFGAEVEYASDRVIFKSITLDGPLYKYGVNAGDELLAINGMRILKDRYADALKFLRPNVEYKLTLTRLGQLIEVPVVLELAPRKITTLAVKDVEIASKIFK